MSRRARISKSQEGNLHLTCRKVLACKSRLRVVPIPAGDLGLHMSMSVMVRATLGDKAQRLQALSVGAKRQKGRTALLGSHRCLRLEAKAHQMVRSKSRKVIPGRRAEPPWVTAGRVDSGRQVSISVAEVGKGEEVRVRVQAQQSHSPCEVVRIPEAINRRETDTGNTRGAAAKAYCFV